MPPPTTTTWYRSFTTHGLPLGTRRVYAGVPRRDVTDGRRAPLVWARLVRFPSDVRDSAGPRASELAIAVPSDRLGQPLFEWDPRIPSKSRETVPRHRVAKVVARAILDERDQ